MIAVQIIRIFEKTHFKMRFSNEIKTALLFIFGIALFLIGFSYLKSNDVFVSDRIFYGIYENTEGLLNGTPVTINGFQVGAVESANY